MSEQANNNDCWNTISGLDAQQAEDLLTRLEQQGCSEREVRFDDAHGLIVRWHLRPRSL